jgi:hypothetical protein
MINPSLSATLNLLEAERSAVAIYKRALSHSLGDKARLLGEILANHEDSVAALEECVRDFVGDFFDLPSQSVDPVTTNEVPHGKMAGISGYKVILAAESVQQGVRWLVLNRLLPITEDNLNALAQLEDQSDRKLVA